MMPKYLRFCVWYKSSQRVGFSIYQAIIDQTDDELAVTNSPPKSINIQFETILSDSQRGTCVCFYGKRLAGWSQRVLIWLTRSILGVSLLALVRARAKNWFTTRWTGFTNLNPITGTSADAFVPYAVSWGWTFRFTDSLVECSSFPALRNIKQPFKRWVSIPEESNFLPIAPYPLIQHWLNHAARRARWGDWGRKKHVHER